MCGNRAQNHRIRVQALEQQVNHGGCGEGNQKVQQEAIEHQAPQEEGESKESVERIISNRYSNRYLMFLFRYISN